MAALFEAIKIPVLKSAVIEFEVLCMVAEWFRHTGLPLGVFERGRNRAERAGRQNGLHSVLDCKLEIRRAQFGKQGHWGIPGADAPHAEVTNHDVSTQRPNFIPGPDLRRITSGMGRCP